MTSVGSNERGIHCQDGFPPSEKEKKMVEIQSSEECRSKLSSFSRLLRPSSEQLNQSPEVQFCWKAFVNYWFSFLPLFTPFIYLFIYFVKILLLELSFSSFRFKNKYISKFFIKCCVVISRFKKQCNLNK